MKIYKCFPEGKHKVLTLSYDDGKLQDRQLIEILNRYGIKGTFHINSGLTDMDIRIKPDEFRDLYKGHEVACHTLNHPTIARCPMEAVINEVLEDRKNLENIMGYPVVGLSYPNGSYNKQIEDILPALGIKYSRIVGDSDSFDLPDNLYEWKATCHHNHNLIENATRFVETTKKQYLYLMYVWGHSYEFDRDDNWSLIEEFCELVGGKDDIWYATNIEIVRYLEVLDRLEFGANNDYVYNPSADSAWISIDNVPKEIPGGQIVRL